MRSRCTRIFCSLVKTGVLLGPIALAVTPTAPAFAGVNDPLQVIYLFSGVRDNGGAAGTGTETAVHCTNFSGNTEIIQFVVFNFDGTQKANANFTAPQLRTVTAVTHHQSAYTIDVDLATGLINQGLLEIVATTVYVVCTAQVLDASNATPSGVDLHPMRWTPIPAVQE